MGHVTMLRGHVLDVLAALPAASVHCVVTSPPYWGLRDYGLDPQVWGGDARCAHEWVDQPKIHRGGASGGGAATDGRDQSARNAVKDRDAGAFCSKCDAWRGHLGLEPTPQLYVDHMVSVCRAIRRVLRKEGTLWLNMGDCYATGAGSVGDHPGGDGQGARWKGFDVGDVTRHRDSRRRDHGQPARNGRGQKQRNDAKGRGHPTRADGSGGHQYVGPKTQPNRLPIEGLKPKDLVMMPARLALALQADGWWVRADIVWSKPNPMPESVTDRPTRSHEYIYLLTRSQRYFYDAAAIAEPASEATHARISQSSLEQQQGGPKQQAYREDFPGKKSRDRTQVEIVKALAKKAGVNPKAGERDLEHGRQNESYSEAIGRSGIVLERNARTVWEIPTQPYPEAHFATFPEELARRCILAGSSPRTCEHCGAPWRRIVEAEGGTIGRSWNDHDDDLARGQRGENAMKGQGYRRVARGWKPTCDCTQEGTGRAVILDPFGGSGTTAQIATGHGRDAIYVDLNPEYPELARHRIGPLLVASDESQTSLK